MIEKKLNELEAIGIKVAIIEITGFIMENIDFEKSFKTKHSVHLHFGNEISGKIVYYYSFNGKYLSLTYKGDSIDTYFEIVLDYNYMKIAEFIRENWIKFKFKKL